MVDPAALIEEAKIERAALLDLSHEISQLPTRRSPTIGKLALALSKAQGMIKSAVKSADNPFFKSKYADLDAHWEVWRPAGAANELAVIQTARAIGKVVVITTLLAHSSDEWIEESLTLIAAQDTPQGIVAAVTYGRRCALSAMVGTSSTDDDGNEASRTLPKDTHWDKGSGKLQQAPPPQVSAPESHVPTPSAGGAAPVSEPPVVVPPVVSGSTTSAPPPAARPPLPKPKGVSVPATTTAESMTVTAQTPAQAGVTIGPPPPGKPPQRMEP